MNQQLVEAVRQLPLNPLIDPSPVSWWPPALGWWMLVLLVIVTGLLLWFIGYRRYLQPALRLQRQKKRLRQEILPLLRDRGSEAATSINRILKAHLLSLGHTECKTLTGQAWLNYLSAQAQLQPAEADALAPLGSASYRPPASHVDGGPSDKAFARAILLLARRLSPGSSGLAEKRGIVNG
ncbi:DUF4381 domain-containing protein [Allohahella marinimesophila]|uniref:DUF4381 domain-containing protein n=1 Tax=Allohahella marinimesophila TaxID=1054972 RepID=A0ABP7QAJ3_9GAMM